MTTEYKGIQYTEQQIKSMREWAKDCQWNDDIDNEFIDELTSTQVLIGIEKHYDGGIAQFLLDSTPVFNH